jgi:GntR family transcriptional regulator, vanillate catabolism transcriptional regulator
MPESSPPSARTNALRAVVELRSQILDGRLPGGARLFEVPLAEALEISRTPVREAMSRLAEEGLLDRGRSGGFVVRRFTAGDVLDAIELRGVIEGTAARMAAERGVSPEGLERLDALQARLDACFGDSPDDVDFETYAELNEQFHALLGELSGSEVIRRELERATRLPFASPSAFLTDRADMKPFRQSLHIAQEQHRAIVSAIRHREGARAEFLMREHARIARRNLEYVMFDDPGLKARLPGFALVGE